ncbi:MAG: hypothetical protein EZS28_033311 [Streblomastix strix]|uniref:Uncharacterized protein n=1 Tax=Streblomastix strix TaxID=222440 RepID=A0A5J4UM76_9EUKA|nr:MAG: hypothetical protein EZS28_033311 [Streblomastix strix]
MHHLEHCIGIHVSSDVSRCDELKQLPNLVSLLISDDSTIRIDTLEKIIDEIGKAKMELCRAEQFSGLLNGLVPILQNLLCKEAEQAINIIELLSNLHFNMVQAEKGKLNVTFKETNISKILKEAFLNQATPSQIKETLVFSITIWNSIDNSTDQCFKPILDYLLDILKTEEERLQLHPYNPDEELKRNKYGYTTLESVLVPFGTFSVGSIDLQKAIINIKGIEIGERYLNHPSERIRISASCMRLKQFRNEEREEKIQKKFENEESQVLVECEECGDIIPFGRFLLHMKNHNAFQNMHYEIDEIEQENEKENEDYDSVKAAQMRVLEDFEGEGLMETAQQHFFQDKYYLQNNVRYLFNLSLGLQI